MRLPQPPSSRRKTKRSLEERFWENNRRSVSKLLGGPGSLEDRFWRKNEQMKNTILGPPR